MHFTKLDAYFYMAAQGDPEAFEYLYEEFSVRAKNMIKIILSLSPNYARNPEDFYYLIDNDFCYVLNTYYPEKGYFSNYVDYFCKTRFAGRIKELLVDEVTNLADFDKNLDQMTSIERMPDPNQIPMSSELAISNFKYKIATPRKDKTNLQRITDKIILLQYAGFSNAEICKHLKMTYSQLRTVLSRIHEQRDIINLKLDLK